MGIDVDVVGPPGRWVRLGGPAAALGGALWAVAPLPGMFLESRWVNAVYLLPLALLLVGMAGLRLQTECGPEGDVGYLLTLGGMALSLAGSLLEAALRPATLVEWGLGGGLVFFAGFYLLLLGSLFLGIGLWRGTVPSRAGAALLVLSLPVAVVGFRAFNSGGLADVNWIPFTVPYGVAWVVLGYGLWAARRSGTASPADAPEQAA